MIMTNAEQLIAKLINEGKITGEEAIILINACRSDPPKSNLDEWPLHKTITYKHSNTNDALTNSNISYLNGTRIRDFNDSLSVSL
jgi:hypothetical protein